MVTNYSGNWPNWKSSASRSWLIQTLTPKRNRSSRATLPLIANTLSWNSLRINLPEAQHRRAQTAERLAKLSAALAADQDKLKQIRDEIVALAAKVEQEQEYRAEVERIRNDVQRLLERKAICEQELNAIAAGRESKQRLAARLTAAQQEHKPLQ